MALAHVYLAEGFEEIEMVSIADILRRAGVEVKLVSLTENLTVHGAHAIAMQADLPFSAATALADAIILPGGGQGTQNMIASPALAQRLQAHLAGGKRVAAICAAPMALAKAGILKGRQACCYPGCEGPLVENGATVSSYNVVTDGPVTTSRGPATAGMFALELVRLLAGEAKAHELARGMLYA
ncbi:4-methyl-5(b-hydroxyethyl)-thiazole monophosphate biosynthesis [Formivibrio citricus]|uniref:4-methyl-5(B-hydroxyethyl)-thiazole monophosphate biosynthesis n=1 Tax=Formivibrio citricus TaxID=83765 RepID=A0A1I4V0S9_9NEIS|nr:DJ-1 family glyoxalase III [Formivibrio citricus]SFM94786.1 4-methyl-5(b-hydroxyethyl)-thiazole monophosphate biosynthesis [Formivibrio citricus]